MTGKGRLKILEGAAMFLMTFIKQTEQSDSLLWVIYKTGNGNAYILGQ